MPKTLKLKVVSQERELLNTDQVSQITAPTTEGEITILPDHIPLFTRITTGELRYLYQGKENMLITSNGFLTIAPDNSVTVMVDSGVLEREISLEKAQQAVKAAQETMKTSENRRELLLAEASLRRALLEIKVAQRTHRTTV